MHYRDGTPARVGDRVRGTGYNVKGPDGKPEPFDGIVVGLTPGSATCNVEVAYLRSYGMSSAQGVRYESGPGSYIAPKGTLLVGVGIEYGQADAFDYVGPRTDDRFAAAQG